MIRDFQEFKSLFRKKMPCIDSEKFYAGPFFLSEFNGVKRVAVHYQNSQSPEHDQCFIYLIEIFSSKRFKEVDFSNLQKEEWNEVEILRGYKPDFTPTRNSIQNIGKWISWKEGNELHSLVLGQDNSREKLKEYFRLLKKSKETIPELEIFDFLSYFPCKVGELSLEFISLWIQSIEEENTKHQIDHLQGNYKLGSGEKTLNLELRFGCGCEAVKDALKEIPDQSSLKDVSKIEVNGKSLKLKTIKDFKNQPEVKAFFRSDEENSCTLIVHNNQTTEFESCRGQMRNLVEEGLKSLEDYSLIDRILDRKMPRKFGDNV